MLLGSAITAAGLQFFLLPNHLLDGGVTGVSIIAAELTGLPLGVFLAILNIPFVYLGYKKFGKDFATYSGIGIITLALLTIVHIDHGFTDVPILAAVFGGVTIGLGIGIVLRYGGIIDGADTIAVLIDRVTVFSVSEAIMAINSVINELIAEPVTYVKESDENEREPHGVMLAVITRFQEQKIKTAVRKIDPKAYIVITDAHEVVGKVSEGSLYREAA